MHETLNVPSCRPSRRSTPTILGAANIGIYKSSNCVIYRRERY